MGVEIPNSLLEKADNAVKAPVYRDGDWWVFRVKREGQAPQEYRVTYKNGKFESANPEFLTGTDDTDSLVFGPLVSVHLIDPEKRWLDFPLVRGKKWSFRYSHVLYLSSVMGLNPEFDVVRWYYADAEVIGLAPKSVETPAGEFKVIEIKRTEDGPETTRNLTYFYSPETKTVVKLEIRDGSSWVPTRHDQMELVKYGRGSPVVKAPTSK